ncbi:ABC-three component system protein [uncultured Brachyspira sp.]|uniref:ABC-three component system protein n=1 Tax=uncultured Brachyspira sp. TaxID=221953 RepID=UPI002610F6B3|nr:ABC-three component system protein [uncultured Brachyspira sp.]
MKNNDNKQKPRSYSILTLKKLHALSLNRCYNPDCNKNIFINENGKYINIGYIAHIIAHSEKGPRANPNISEKELKDFHNLILLCPNCHTQIDKSPEKYTIDLLHQWKTKRESEAISKKINENNGVLEIAIEHIANMDVDNLDYDNKAEIFDIDNKILYNNLKHNKIYIDEYKVYYGKIDAIYKELENFNSFKKTKLLRKIRQFYIDEIKENYNGTNDINIIRENSDNIFDNIKERIENCLSNVEEDDVYIALPIILVDAFIRCKILEEPK